VDVALEDGIVWLGGTGAKGTTQRKALGKSSAEYALQLVPAWGWLVPLSYLGSGNADF